MSDINGRNPYPYEQMSAWLKELNFGVPLGGGCPERHNLLRFLAQRTSYPWWGRGLELRPKRTSMGARGTWGASGATGYRQRERHDA
jgi:hypothetical protein